MKEDDAEGEKKESKFLFASSLIERCGSCNPEETPEVQDKPMSLTLEAVGADEEEIIEETTPSQKHSLESGLMAQFENEMAKFEVEKGDLKKRISLLIQRNFEEMVSAWKYFDSNDDNRLSLGEIVTGLQGLGFELSREDASTLIEIFGGKTDTKIDYSDFLSTFSFPGCHPHERNKESWLAETESEIRLLFKGRETSVINAFRRMDSNKDGKLSREEFQRGIQSFLKLSLSRPQFKALWDNVDTDRSGNIEYSEFVAKFSAYGSIRKKVGASSAPRSTSSRRSLVDNLMAQQATAAPAPTPITTPVPIPRPHQPAIQILPEPDFPIPLLATLSPRGSPPLYDLDAPQPPHQSRFFSATTPTFNLDQLESLKREHAQTRESFDALVRQLLAQQAILIDKLCLSEKRETGAGSGIVSESGEGRGTKPSASTPIGKLEMSDLRTSVAELEKTIRALQGSLEAQQATIDQHTKRAAEPTSNALSVAAGTARKYAVAADEVMSKLFEMLEIIRCNIEIKAQRRSEVASSTPAELEAIVLTLQRDNEDSRNQIKMLEQAISDTKKLHGAELLRVTSLSKSSETPSTSSTALRRVLDLETKLNSLEEEVSTLRRRLSDSNAELNRARKERDNLQDIVHGLRSEAALSSRAHTNLEQSKTDRVSEAFRSWIEPVAPVKKTCAPLDQFTQDSAPLSIATPAPTPAPAPTAPLPPAHPKIFATAENNRVETTPRHSFLKKKSVPGSGSRLGPVAIRSSTPPRVPQLTATDRRARTPSSENRRVCVGDDGNLILDKLEAQLVKAEYENLSQMMQLVREKRILESGRRAL